MPYELVYIVRPTVDEQTLAAVNEKISKFITDNTGEIIKRDDWGKKRLAYPLMKFTEGFYQVFQLNLPPNAVRELERSLQLTEDILRYLIVRSDQP
ncbi:MAG: 30S ribosomal protein S6 [Chloroflexi bacterium]|nr:30S ribosomal protein S6 [Chloroflexota bacterium]